MFCRAVCGQVSLVSFCAQVGLDPFCAQPLIATVPIISMIGRTAAAKSSLWHTCMNAACSPPAAQDAVLDVAGGAFSCCTRNHPDGKPCDKQKIVGILAAHCSYSHYSHALTMRVYSLVHPACTMKWHLVLRLLGVGTET